MKKLVILSFSVAFLALSVFIVNAATFEGPPAGCNDPEGTGCNLDGVIWNRSTADPAQNASYHISGDSRTDGSARVGNGLRVDSNGASIFGDVLVSGKSNAGNGIIEMWSNGDLKMTDGKALRVDLNNAASALNIGNYGNGDYPVNVNIQGTISVAKDQILSWGGTPNVSAPQFCLDGDCITSWPSGGGGLTEAQADDLYVNETGDTMTGILAGTQFQANTNISSPVYYSGTYGTPPYGRWWRDEIELVDSNGQLNLSANTLQFIRQTWSGSWPVQFDFRSLSNYGSVVGQAYFGNLDTIGYFYKPSTGGSLSILDGSDTLISNGTARFNDSVCIGGVCRTDWPEGGAGDITGVSAGTGIDGGGTSGNVNLSINPLYRLPQSGCSTGYTVKWNGSGWGCAPDQNSGGDVTGVSAGHGLTGGGSSGDLTIDLGGGDGINVHPNNIEIASSFRLPQTCLNGKIAVFNESSGVWDCGHQATGDITGVSAGNGLTGGGSSGYPTINVGSGNGITVAADTVSVDTNYLDGRYPYKNTNASMNYSLNLINNRSGNTGWVALRADGAEALWYDGTKMSWGFDATYNLFHSKVILRDTNDASTALNDFGALMIGYEDSSNLRFDSNEIFAMNNHNLSTLHLHADGGTVRIGQNSGGSVIFDVNGDAYKVGGGSWGDYSDGRLKQDIQPMTNSLDLINQLNGVNFSWINPEEHGNNKGRVGGFIAQDVEKVFPDWVEEIDPQEGDEDLVNGKAKAISLPVEFDALVVESIKELKNENDYLKVKIDDLKNRIEKLENK